MINREKFKNLIIQAEGHNDINARYAITEVLRPRKEDSIDEIYEKIRLFQNLFFGASKKYKDAQYHKDIDFTYAEQIHSYLNTGKPKYKGLIIIGFRESAKTTKVKFNDTYLICYLPELMDSIHIVSENETSSSQFTMDLFNILGFSKLKDYFDDLIPLENKTKKKESQTMSKFSTTTGVTIQSKPARKTSRGNVKVDITDDGEVETKRPKKITFDDIENETTIRSYSITEHIDRVMSASIDGMDQTLGSWTLLGNYLSLRGNINKYLKKYEDDPKVKIIMIPIMDGAGNPTWEDKYVRTDKEELELAEKGIIKNSIESIERDSDNFQTEYMNNPSRFSVYFEDDLLVGTKKEPLIQETHRDEDGFLEIEEPDKHSVYVISVDCAKGNGGDQSAFTIIKITGLRYKEVANFKSNKITPKDFAPYTVTFAKKYNNALIIPENNYPGNEFIAFLIPIYNNIFKTEVKRDENNQPVYEYGVNTNLKTKPEMFLNVKKLMQSVLIEIRSQIMYNQISEYPAQDIHILKTKDGSGGHFDLLQSFAIGLYKSGHISDKTAGEDIVNRILERQIDNVFIDVDNYR